MTAGDRNSLFLDKATKLTKEDKNQASSRLSSHSFVNRSAELRSKPSVKLCVFVTFVIFC